MTAEDVVWTFNTLREHGRPFFRAYWADVAEVVAEGPRRVAFRFKTNENRELALILGQLPVLPKHWWEGRDFTRPLLEAPLGSGPYRLERFESGRSLVYRRVPDCWAKDLPTARGTPISTSCAMSTSATPRWRWKPSRPGRSTSAPRTSPRNGPPPTNSRRSSAAW